MNSRPNIHENKDFNDQLKQLLKLKADKLMSIFIQEGPEALKEKLEIKYDRHWEFIFDYLVLDENIVKRCVVRYMPFFKQLVTENGPMVLKKVFQLEDKKYKAVFEQIFDLVAVANGALYDYVYINRKKFAFAIFNGEAKNLRSLLGLKAHKYSNLWYDILNLLQEAVCNKLYSDHAFENGLLAFNKLMNSMREHRSLRSFRAMWIYSTQPGN
jgi:hypothetical protein